MQSLVRIIDPGQALGMKQSLPLVYTSSLFQIRGSPRRFIQNSAAVGYCTHAGSSVINVIGKKGCMAGRGKQGRARNKKAAEVVGGRNVRAYGPWEEKKEEAETTMGNGQAPAHVAPSRLPGKFTIEQSRGKKEQMNKQKKVRQRYNGQQVLKG